MPKRANRNAYDGKRPTAHDFDPSAIRGALGKALLNAIAADFTRHGAERIRVLIEQRPLDYLKLVVALVPKEFRLKEVELPDMTEEELAGMLGALKEVIAAKEKEERGEGPGTQKPGGAGD